MLADERRRWLRRAAGRCWLTCAAGAALALGACHHAPPPPSTATPVRAVATALRLTAEGNFDALMQNRLPAPDYATWRADWDAARARQGPPSTARAQQFAEIMRMLTEPDAEARLAKRLQPQLAALKDGKSGGTPIFSGILEAAGKEMIASSPQLGPAERTMATQSLAALVAWVGSTDFSDPKKAKRAIALVCTTARSLHVATLDQWRALDYATTMKDYGILWNGLEELTHLYGLDLARTFTDAKITATEAATRTAATTANTPTADAATVTVAMTLAGKPVTGAWAMRKVGGHWYDASLLDAWQKAHPAAAASASAPPSAATAAPAGSAGAPPAASGPAPASGGAIRH